MLGHTINDPEGIEDNAGSSSGFSLLDLHTTLQPGKQLKNIVGKIIHPALKTATFNGYEIHCGESTAADTPLLTSNDSRTDGAINNDNNVLGTYIHGLFDNPEATDSILQWAGLTDVQTINIDEIREQQLERLSQTLEKHFDPAFLNSIADHKQ